MTASRGALLLSLWLRPITVSSTCLLATHLPIILPPPSSPLWQEPSEHRRRSANSQNPDGPALRSIPAPCSGRPHHGARVINNSSSSSNSRRAGACLAVVEAEDSGSRTREVREALCRTGDSELMAMVGFGQQQNTGGFGQPAQQPQQQQQGGLFGGGATQAANTGFGGSYCPLWSRSADWSPRIRWNHPAAEPGVWFATRIRSYRTEHVRAARFQ
jgi:hypothetical protein